MKPIRKVVFTEKGQRSKEGVPEVGKTGDHLAFYEPGTGGRES